MERSASVGINGGRFGDNHFCSPSFSSSSSMRHVNYSCGSCGYELNLSSTNRITSSIGSKYGKSIKSGIISFFNIDEGRFSQFDEFQCMPHFSRRYPNTPGNLILAPMPLIRVLNVMLGMFFFEDEDGLRPNSLAEMLMLMKH